MHLVKRLNIKGGMRLSEEDTLLRLNMAMKIMVQPEERDYAIFKRIYQGALDSFEKIDLRLEAHLVLVRQFQSSQDQHVSRTKMQSFVHVNLNHTDFLFLEAFVRNIGPVRGNDVVKMYDALLMETPKEPEPLAYCDGNLNAEFDIPCEKLDVLHGKINHNLVSFCKRLDLTPLDGWDDPKW